MLPFAVLLFAILGAVVLTVVAMAQRANEAAEDRARFNLVSALAEEVNETARQLNAIITVARTNSVAGVGAGPGALDAMLERIRLLGEFDAVAIIGSDGGVQAAVTRLTYGQAAAEQHFSGGFGWAGRELSARPRSAAEAGTRLIGRYIVEHGSLVLLAAAMTPVPDAQGAIGVVASRSSMRKRSPSSACACRSATSR